VTLDTTAEALHQFAAEAAVWNAFADDRPWAITPRALTALLKRRGSAAMQAVAARAGVPVDDESDAEQYGATAVVNIRGPLFRYRSIWTWLLGGTSVQETALDLHAALDEPTVKNIVLAINSPGGQVDGVNELANMIRAANGVKPVTAYVDGLAASGAYWLASAAGRIVADETAQLGSIGVLATVTDERDADARRGVKTYEVISSQSPLKRTDPATDEGQMQLQQMVDALAQVFIAQVAKFRGTSEERVASDFGRGATLPARSAVAAGMADSLGSLEGLLESGDDNLIHRVKDVPALRVATGARVKLAAPFDEEELEEDTETQGALNDEADCTCPPGTDPADCHCGDQTDESEGTEQEPDDSSIPEGETNLLTPTEDRQRIAAILTCEEAKGREELARTLALETNHTVDAAKRLLAVAPAPAPPPKVNALEARMSEINNPQVGAGGDQTVDDSPAAEAQRILSFVPKDRKRAIQ
jgi:signal peptide peptidase SppA